MEIISLFIKTRRGVVVNQTQLIDIDDIAAPLVAVNSGLDSQFTLREGKKGPFSNQSPNTAIETYVSDETLAQIAVLGGNIFTANVISVKGRFKAVPQLMGFNAKFIAGVIKPTISGGSSFRYQEDSDPDLVEYTVSQTPAQILAQLTSNTIFQGWALNGNTNGVEKYIGTNDNYAFPVRVNNTERFRFLTDGTIQYPLNAQSGYVLTSDGTGIATWQPMGGGSVVNELDPVISQINPPPGGPVAGDRYLVGTAPTGVWVGHANQISEWDGAAWVYTIPVLDDYVYITTTLTTKRFNGTIWVTVPGIAILQNGNTLGTNMSIGTNDAKSLLIKTANINRAQITAAGNFNILNNVYVGAISTVPTAKMHIHGSGITSATYSVKVEDSGSASLFVIRNDGFLGIGSLTPIGTERFLIKGSSDSTQLIVQGNAVQSNTSPLFKLSKSDGTDLMWINSDFNTNVFIGINAGSVNNAAGGGIDNTFTGFGAGAANGIGSLNTYYGKRAGEAGVNVSGNTAVGAGALLMNIAGSDCSAFGYHALMKNTANNNIAIGNFSAMNNVSGASLVAIGKSSLLNNASGNADIAIGLESMISLLSGDLNIGLGQQSMYLKTGGSYNICVGGTTLYSNVNGFRNVAIGDSAGYLNTGSDSVFIGHNAGYSEVASNKLYIANSNTVTPLIYGDFATTYLKFYASKISIPLVQTGNAGLVTGEMYVDTAANILANGDLVVGRKV